MGMLYYLLLQWNKVNNPFITRFQEVCLVFIGIGLLTLVILVFLHCKKEIQVDSHARRFFHIWPLVHIAMSTLYQLITQIVSSHWSVYLIPSLYSAWATTISVGIHLFLHSLSIFWKF